MAEWAKSCARDNIQPFALIVACAVGAGMLGTTFPESWYSESDTTTISPLLHSQEGQQFVAVAAAMASTVHDSGAVFRYILQEMPAIDPEGVMPTLEQWEALVQCILREASPALSENSTPNDIHSEHLVLSDSAMDQRPLEALRNLATVFGVPVTVKTKLHGLVRFELPLGTTGLVITGNGDLQKYVVVVKKAV